MSDQLLWLLNRSSGVVILVLFTLTVVLGALSHLPGPGPSWWPRFLSQGLHRHLAVLSTVLLVVHIATAVLDEFVQIDWWSAVLPFGATYRPTALHLGALAVDLLVLVILSGLLRRRLGDRSWRVLHAASWLCWAAAVLHTLGIGTDADSGWLRAVVAGCVGAVVAVAALRLGHVVLGRRSEQSHLSAQVRLR